MLTAVNVAKSCHLVEAAEKVYFVNVSPPTYNSSASLKFIPSEPTIGDETREVNCHVLMFTMRSCEVHAGAARSRTEL